MTAAALAVSIAGCAAQAPASFSPLTVAENVEGAYLMTLGDVNVDGRTDIILLSVRSPDVHWYENPDWRRHTLVSGVSPAAVGAAVDKSEDGAARIVLLTGFHRDDYEKNAGELVFLRTGEAAGETPPAPASIFVREPAAHRAQFGDVDGDGDRELVVAPLSGAGGGPPIDSSAATPLVYFDPPDPTRHVIVDGQSGTVHGLTLVRWDGDERDDVLTAGFDGVFLHQFAESDRGIPGWRSERLTPGRVADENGRPGAGDIRVGKLKSGERFLATIESVHGGEVATYRADGDGVWIEATNVALDWRPFALLAGELPEVLSPSLPELERLPLEPERWAQAFESLTASAGGATGSVEPGRTKPSAALSLEEAALRLCAVLRKAKARVA